MIQLCYNFYTQQKKKVLNMANKCAFCNNNCHFLFNLNGYSIFQCEFCKTSFVENMPSIEELKNYYSGFKFQICESNKDLICSEGFKRWFESYNLPREAKMLDLGGGGGFFSYAFEKFGFGKATYVDLDNEACDYARKLNISKVVNDDVKNIKNNSDEKYDFIYCRHVIEHLVNPTDIISTAIDLLSENGVFILQFPNGTSIERHSEKAYFEKRLSQISQSNGYSRFQSALSIFSDKTSYGLDPINHLWAISPKGLKSFLNQKENIKFKIKTASITDKIYSPYFPKDERTISAFITKIKRFIFKRLGGGAHLVCEISKKECEK